MVLAKRKPVVIERYSGALTVDVLVAADSVDCLNLPPAKTKNIGFSLVESRSSFTKD